MQGGHDHIGGGDRGDELLGYGGGHQADVLAQPTHVDLAEPLAQDVDRAPGGVQVAGGQLEQGGLARAVRAEHDPAFTRLDLPVDVVEDRSGETVEVYGGEARGSEGGRSCRRAR